MSVNSGDFNTALDLKHKEHLTSQHLVKWLGSNRQATIAGIMVLTMVALALLAPVVPLQDPVQTNYDQVLASPSGSHLLGTDLHGRDQLARLWWASRTSLAVGVVATGLALAGGLFIGGIAGYGGRPADRVLMRIADIFLSFPVILGAIAIMAIFGPGRRNIFIAIAFFGWPVFARLFRSSVLAIKEMTFVKAARGLGASDLRIFMVHILPNSWGPILSFSSMMVATAIMAEAGLSYIGLGVQPPDPSWGLMLSESAGMFERAPWLIIAPGVAITFTALVFIILGRAAGGTGLDARSNATEIKPAGKA